MNNATVLLVVTKTVTLILGALITFLAYRAYRRQGAPALKALMLGFALVTVGSAAGGALYHVAEVNFTLGVGVESLVTAAGFAVLVYSLYSRTDGDASIDVERHSRTDSRTNEASRRGVN